MFATIQQLYTTNYTDQSDFDGQNSGHDYMGTVRFCFLSRMRAFGSMCVKMSRAALIWVARMNAMNAHTTVFCIVPFSSV